jgi:hypothetical protein
LKDDAKAVVMFLHGSHMGLRFTDHGVHELEILRFHTIKPTPKRKSPLEAGVLVGEPQSPLEAGFKLTLPAVLVIPIVICLFFFTLLSSIPVSCFYWMWGVGFHVRVICSCMLYLNYMT